MGCCASKQEPEAEQLQSQSVLPPFSEKTASPRSFSAKKEKNYAQEPNHNNDQNSQPLKNEQPNNTSTNPTKETSENGWDLDASEREQHRREHEQKMAVKQHEIEEDHKRLQELNDAAFDAQVTRQRSKTFVGLYQIFAQYATNADKTKMDIDGVTEALKHFGMPIDFDRIFQKDTFKQFDIDNEGEIDYNDFSSTMSSLIDTKNDDMLTIVFQIFDNDQDGYLMMEDMARLLLAQNQIVVVITGQQSTKTTVTYNKRQCLKLARKMISKYDNNKLDDSKISFEEFSSMMKNFTEQDMMIDNMSMVSQSINIANVVANININSINGTPVSGQYTPSKSSKMIPVFTPNQKHLGTPKIDT